MATIVCQGLQSCLEPGQLVEPRTLMLKFSSARPSHFSQPIEFTFKSCYIEPDTKRIEEKCSYEEVSKKSESLPNSELGGWRFLQALSDHPQSSKETAENKNTYVHPLVKRSLSTLSEKSLELCTENLGNETGSDITEDSIFSLSPSSDSEGGNYSPRREHWKTRQLSGARKAISRNFPPPLTTISGSESLQVRPHREDGRLVIKAVKAPSQHTLFHAERTNGRLRLCLLKESTSTFDYEEEANEESGASSNEDNKEEFENDGKNWEEEEEAYEEEELDEEEEYDEGWSSEDMDENRMGMGAEMGIEKFQRPGSGRCKEGEQHENKGLLNWEPFLVATS